MTDDYRRQYAKAMGDTAAFLRGIASDPYDSVRLAVFADHLDEKGLPALAHEIRRHALDGDSNNWWPFVNDEPHQMDTPEVPWDYGMTNLGRYGDFDVYHHTEGGAGQTPRHVVTFVPNRSVEPRRRLRFHVEVEPNEGSMTDGVVGFADRLRSSGHHDLANRFTDSVIEKARGRDEF